jgi:hypothetical protein
MLSLTSQTNSIPLAELELGMLIGIRKPDGSRLTLFRNSLDDAYYLASFEDAVSGRNPIPGFMEESSLRKVCLEFGVQTYVFPDSRSLMCWLWSGDSSSKIPVSR